VWDLCKDSDTDPDPVPYYWWDRALDWSCNAGVVDKVMEAVAMEMSTIPSHSHMVIRMVSGLQILLLQEAEKLEVSINLNYIEYS